MKIDFDKEYIKKVKYGTLAFVIIYLIYTIIENINIVLQTTGNVITRLISIFMPLIWGIVIAYLCSPIVRCFEKILKKIIKIKDKHNRKNDSKCIRGISVFLTITLVLVIIILVMYSVFIIISGSFKEFSIEQTWFYIHQYILKYHSEFERVLGALEDIGISNSILEIMYSFTEGFYDGVLIIIGILALEFSVYGKYVIDICFGIALAINLLFNPKYFIGLTRKSINFLFSKRVVQEIRIIAKDIDKVFMSFIRAKILDLTLLSIVTVISLIIIDFKFSLLIGLFAGYTNIIPYLGTWIGIIPAVVIALIEGSLGRAFLIGAYIVLVQQIYYISISPKIQGDSIGINAFFAILAVVVFGALFGFIGMVFAIPIAGIFKVLLCRIIFHSSRRKNRKV